MSKKSIKTVLFDLDGTFADTAPDLADALNHTLSNHNRPVIELEQIRQVVSHGGRALIELGFNMNEQDPNFEPLRQELLGYYQEDLAKHTQLFPGINKLLLEIEAANMHWGIVTNKPAWLTDPLMASLEMHSQPCSIVSGDTLPERKPHPAPLLHAGQQCQTGPANCIYIGDAERDIIAGKQAGMLTLVALYGYISNDDDPDDWQADGYINSPDEIFPWIAEYLDN